MSQQPSQYSYGYGYASQPQVTSYGNPAQAVGYGNQAQRMNYGVQVAPYNNQAQVAAYNQAAAIQAQVVTRPAYGAQAAAYGTQVQAGIQAQVAPRPPYGTQPQVAGYGVPAVNQTGSSATPSVGYTPYQAQQQPKPPAAQTVVTQPSVSAYLQQSYNQPHSTGGGYYGYQQAYPNYYPQTTNVQANSYPASTPRPLYSATTMSQTVAVSYPTYRPSAPSYTPASTTSQRPFATSSTPYTSTSKYTTPSSSVQQTAVSTVSQRLTPQQQQVVSQYVATSLHSNGKTGWWNRKQAGAASTKEYYCNVCKISAASEGAYKAHLDGKNHKKKVTQQQLQSQLSDNFKEFYCELCDVACSNADALEAHTKGLRHQKVLNLHRRLGKPIPTLKVGAGEDGKKVLMGPHNIVFVGGRTLQSTMKPSEETPKDLKVYPPTAVISDPPNPEAPSKDNIFEETPVEQELVGEHLIVKVTGDSKSKFYKGSMKCEMCDCYFNDEIAKKAHIKGRRHRTNYKKLYQPDLYVEPTKVKLKERERQKQKRKEAQKERWSQKGKVQVQEKSPDPVAEWDGSWDLTMSPDPYHDPHDDILVLDRHKLIYPLAVEMKAIDKAVAGVEGALKEISDILKKEKATAANGSLTDEAYRDLKGVMRVGAYAQHLLLKDECSAELVLMCENKPTLALFNHVKRKLAVKFESMIESGGGIVYNASSWPDKSSITVVSQVGGYRVTVSLFFTSQAMKGHPSAMEVQAELGEGVLTRQYCVAALAALKHTKWFKAVSKETPASGIVVRVFMDLCRRVPSWGVLDKWMVEVLVQKCASSSHHDYQQPGDLVKRVLECVASGIFLPGGRGLVNPYETELTDMSAPLTASDRARITKSAQHALRLMAFRKLHLVLGVDPLVKQDANGKGVKRGPPKSGGYKIAKKQRTD